MFVPNWLFPSYYRYNTAKAVIFPSETPFKYTLVIYRVLDEGEEELLSDDGSLM